MSVNVVLLLSVTHSLFLVPTTKKNEGREGRREEMEEASLRVSLFFSAAPERAFAI